MENVAIAVVGMLVWPAIALIVVIGFSFALYGLAWALLHWVDKNEVSDDRNSPTNTSGIWKPMDVGCVHRPDTLHSNIEDFDGLLSTDLERCRSLPTSSINRKINPEPGRKL